MENIELKIYSNGQNQGSVATVGDPYAFTGRRFDEESGLYYYRTRYMDPAAGRFISRDTIGIWGDLANLGNGYAYVGNNPFTLIDPYGKVNEQYCQRLAERIENLKNKIKRAENNLELDKLNLPETCAGDDKKPSLSKRGHRQELDNHKQNLTKRETEYRDNCGDPPTGDKTGEQDSESETNKFWEKMGELTGLSGSLLVAYVLISGLTRLIPPRNLVPVP